MLASFQRMRNLSGVSGLGRVIVADADESCYAMVRQLTAPDRWEVRYAGSSGELLQALHSGRAQLAVVNLALVDEEIQEELIERSRRGLSVVITSDVHDEATERKARLMSTVFYAPKPVHMHVLRQVFDGALQTV